MTPFHNTVSLRGFHFEDSLLTFNLATGIVIGDIGKAVALDATAANTVKLAGAGDTVLGRLEVVEDRTVEGQLIGTVALRFANLLPVDPAGAVAVGDTVVGGATAGTVDRLEAAGVAAPNHSINFVAEIIGTDAVVVKI